MKTKSLKRYRTQAEWQKLISGHPQSGLSVRAYCKQQGIGDQSFYQWRRRLENSSEPDTQMVDITSMLDKVSNGADQGRWQIQLDLGNGLKLNLKQA